MSGEYPDRDPQVFYELARDRHAAQAALLDSLDSKLVFLLSGSSALLGILVAVYALRTDAFEGWGFVLPAASVAAWGVLTFFTLKAFRPAAWLNGPKLDKVFNDQFSNKDDATLKWYVASDLWNDYDDNKELENRKTHALKWALRLFIAQTVLLVVALLLLAFSESDTPYRSHRPSAASRDARVLLPQGLPPAVTLAPAVGLAGSDLARLHSSRVRSAPVSRGASSKDLAALVERSSLLYWEGYRTVRGPVPAGSLTGQEQQA